MAGRPTADSVALILAAGVAVALNVMVLAVLWGAVSEYGAGLSENGTQLLTGYGGGIIGVLGSYVGFAFGRKRTAGDDTAATAPANPAGEPPPPPPPAVPFRPPAGQQ